MVDGQPVLKLGVATGIRRPNLQVCVLTADLQLILKPTFHLVKPGMSLFKPYSEKVALANHKDVIQHRSCALLLGKNVNHKSTQQLPLT